MKVAAGQVVPIELVFSDLSDRYHLVADAGTVVRKGSNRWLWTAPTQPGPCRLILADMGMEDALCLEATVVNEVEWCVEARYGTASLSLDITV